MSPLEDARRELRRALGVIAREYDHAGRVVNVDGQEWRRREREIDRAFAAGDVARARTAIAGWLSFALAEIRDGAPAEEGRRHG